ncbi:hypothetical protein DdX_15003 [Ditylenchus destructor]|uniref:Uncharacterized protein n=1 Tax=Ditylenchus destructor TaxID=166010 RepID=A0AAD4MTJ4_9BILA|nr:hypothetical protein DdX_15003 [Ditylenchus destructor]
MTADNSQPNIENSPELDIEKRDAEVLRLNGFPKADVVVELEFLMENLKLQASNSQSSAEDRSSVCAQYKMVNSSRSIEDNECSHESFASNAEFCHVKAQALAAILALVSIMINFLSICTSGFGFAFYSLNLIGFPCWTSVVLGYFLRKSIFYKVPLIINAFYIMFDVFLLVAAAYASVLGPGQQVEVYRLLSQLTGTNFSSNVKQSLFVVFWVISLIMTLGFLAMIQHVLYLCYEQAKNEKIRLKRKRHLLAEEGKNGSKSRKMKTKCKIRESVSAESQSDADNETNLLAKSKKNTVKSKQIVRQEETLKLEKKCRERSRSGVNSEIQENESAKNQSDAEQESNLLAKSKRNTAKSKQKVHQEETRKLENKRKRIKSDAASEADSE